MYSKEETLETALADVELKGARVLIAGGGRRSARAVIDQSPEHLTVACVPDDPGKIDRIINELGGQRNDSDVIQVDLSTPGLFKNNSFDVIFADYLVSKLDTFAPRKHIIVLQNLYDYLKSGGEIVLLDIEPDAPPPFPMDYSSVELQIVVNNQIDAENEINNATRYRFYRRVRKLVIDLALKGGIPGFTQLPGDWVEKWLSACGFENVDARLASRLIQVEIEEHWEKRIRQFIRLIEDLKLRKYAEALMDRSESLLREALPFDIEQDLYFIRAGKK
jgi:SAM-dependent methyltransferase